MSNRSKDGERDIALALGAVVLGGPAALVLGRGAWALLPHFSFARPEIAIAVLIAGLAALLLAVNALASAAALLSLAHALPAGLRRRFAALAVTAGTGAAKRIALRGAASATLGLASFGIVLPGAVAAPVPADPVTDPVGVSWLWSPTGGATDSAASGSTRPAPTDEEATSVEGTARDGGFPDDSATPSAPASPRAESRSASPHESTAPSTESSASADAVAPAIPAESPAPRSAESGAPAPAPPNSPGESVPKRTSTPGASASASSPSSSPATQESARSIEVRPDDSLWSIAAALLETGASDAEITETWRAIYALNADVIGDDPSLIHPGDVLALPQERS